MLAFKDGEGAVEHAHPHKQMMYVLDGYIRVEMQGQTEELGPGCVSHMPPNVPHRVTGIKGGARVLSCKNTLDGAGHKIG